jgi:hypothetical protein
LKAGSDGNNLSLFWRISGGKMWVWKSTIIGWPLDWGLGIEFFAYYEKTFLSRKHERKEKFRAHAVQAPALRVPNFVFA